MKRDLKYLKLLSKSFRTEQEASTEIINLEAILHLPKGTEHFITDLHGENDAFEHVPRNASGVIRQKVEMIFGAARTAGIGVFINNARTVWIDYPAVYAALILIIIVGVIVEYGIFQTIEKMTVKKWGMIQ